jgi:hypothetical protein
MATAIMHSELLARIPAYKLKVAEKEEVLRRLDAIAPKLAAAREVLIEEEMLKQVLTARGLDVNPQYEITAFEMQYPELWPERKV